MQKLAKFRNFLRRGLAKLPESAELPESAHIAQMSEIPALARPNFRGFAPNARPNAFSPNARCRFALKILSFVNFKGLF